jgi:hypothetical protein
MIRRVGIALALLTAAAAAGIEPRMTAKMRGVCWEAVGKVGAQELAPLRDAGVDWMSQTPFGWSRSIDSSEVVLATGSRVYWGESDEGLAETARMGRAIGIRTLLKPHLWVGHRDWCGNLKMTSESRWSEWFGSYEKFILHYAVLAEKERIEALAVGTELCGTSSRAADWKRVIARIRSVYRGRLTYCANWEEVGRVPFWGDLDFIGVQAYYPLAESVSPKPGELSSGWDRISRDLEALSLRTGKPVVFTEVGYRSVSGSLREPWRWDTAGPTDFASQAEAYRALFGCLWGKPWFAGTFIWKWNPYLGSGRRIPADVERDYTPQGKPALDVIRDVYLSGR